MVRTYRQEGTGDVIPRRVVPPLTTARAKRHARYVRAIRPRHSHPSKGCIAGGVPRLIVGKPNDYHGYRDISVARLCTDYIALASVWNEAGTVIGQTTMVVNIA